MHQYMIFGHKNNKARGAWCPSYLSEGTMH